MHRIISLVENYDHIGTDGIKGSIQLLGRKGDPGQADVNRDIDTQAVMAMSVAFMLSLGRIMALMWGPGMIVAGALLVEGRFEFDMTVGPETQNGPVH